MGYTTKFEGIFKLDAQLTFEQYAHLRDMSDKGPPGSPGGYCQWVPTHDARGIEWDRGEKFYQYVEWLDWICRVLLSSWGRKLSGSVKWQGESRDDKGVITVVDNVVTVGKVSLVAKGKTKLETARGALEKIANLHNGDDVGDAVELAKAALEVMKMQ